MISIRSIRDVIRILFIYRLRVIVAMVFTIVAIVAALFIVTPKYQSDAKLLVTLGRVNSTLPVMVQDRPALMAQNFQRDDLIDETTLFQSRAVISKVVERWGKVLSAQPEPRSWFGIIKFQLKNLAKKITAFLRSGFEFLGLLDSRDPEVALIEELENSLKISHDVGGATLNLSLELSSPSLSQQVLNDWINFYLATRLQILNDSNVLNFYEEQLDRTRIELNKIADDRGKIYSQFGGTDLREREQAFNSRIDQLLTERKLRERSLSAAQKMINESKRKIAHLNNHVAAEMETAENPTMRDFTNKLNNLMMQRVDKLRQFSPTSEQIKSLDKSIAEVKSWIRQQPRYYQSGEVTKINPLMTRSEELVIENEILASESNAMLVVLDAQIADLRKERESVLMALNELNELDRRNTVAQSNYELYSSNLEKARIDAELDKSRISNVKVMESATYNPIRIKPRTMLLLGLAPVLGIVFAAFVAYLSVLVDRRIYDGDKLEAIVGVPVLATIPELRKSGESGSDYTCHFAETALDQLLNRLIYLPSVMETGGIVITSLAAGAGVSFLAESLRERLARLQQGKNVALRILEGGPIHDSEGRLSCLLSGDCIVLIIEAGHTTLPALESGLAALRGLSHIRIIGIVLNRRPLVLPEWLYRIFA